MCGGWEPNASKIYPYGNRYILLLIAPQSRSRRQDRNVAIGRQNLEWVLNGHPEAVPLFEL